MRVTRKYQPAVGQPFFGATALYVPLGLNSTTGTGVNGTLTLQPIYVPTTITLDKIALTVTIIGDVGSTIRMGIYSNNANNYPGSLLVDQGTVAGDAVATAELTFNRVLTPGTYWIAAVVQGVTVTSPTVRTISSIQTNQFGVLASSTISGSIGFLAQTGVTGALPATFTSSPAITTTGIRLALKIG